MSGLGILQFYSLWWLPSFDQQREALKQKFLKPRIGFSLSSLNVSELQQSFRCLTMAAIY